jgi:hypothetical protein
MKKMKKVSPETQSREAGAIATAAKRQPLENRKSANSKNHWLTPFLTPVPFSKKIIFWVLWFVVFLNIALPLGASFYAQRHKMTSTLEYNGWFHGQYVIDDPSEDKRYVKNPLLMPYCYTKDAIIDLEISPSEFTASTTPTGNEGHKTIDSSAIGKEIFYLGDGIFTFHVSRFGFGGIFPGTGYSAQFGKIRVSEEAVSIEAEIIKTGMMFFIIPYVEKRTFNQSLPAKREGVTY